MKKRRRIIILSIIVIAVYLYGNFYTPKMISGKYANMNYGDTFIGENPHVPDTLVILDNNKFSSKYYGKGDYKLLYSPFGTCIELNYKDEFGRNGFTTSINRMYFFGNLKIDLFSDLDQYYKKIE